MVPIELERIRGPVIRSTLICKKVSVRKHLRDNRTILKNLSLNVLLLNRNAKICQFVNLVVNSALVGLKMLNIALCSLSLILHALLRDESLLSSPI